jgi:hypothetical protein
VGEHLKQEETQALERWAQERQMRLKTWTGRNEKRENGRGKVGKKRKRGWAQEDVKALS